MYHQALVELENAETVEEVLTAIRKYSCLLDHPQWSQDREKLRKASFDNLYRVSGVQFSRIILRGVDS